MKCDYRDKPIFIIAGFVKEWAIGRKWSRIFRYSIPSILLMLLAGAVYAGGILNQTNLRNHYLQLGRAELERWQDQLAQAQKENHSPLLIEKDTETLLEAGQSIESAKAETKDERKLSRYAEMLFRRAHLMGPSEESEFVIGVTLWQRGEKDGAQRMLEKIAPKHQKGYPAAHAIMAKICREELKEPLVQSWSANFSTMPTSP